MPRLLSPGPPIKKKVSFDPRNEEIRRSLKAVTKINNDL